MNTCQVSAPCSGRCNPPGPEGSNGSSAVRVPRSPGWHLPPMYQVIAEIPPQTFQECHQEHVKTTLENAIARSASRTLHLSDSAAPANHRRAHPGALSELRRGPTATPCGCRELLEITASGAPDVIEIDAASNAASMKCASCAKTCATSRRATATSLHHRRSHQITMRPSTRC